MPPLTNATPAFSTLWFNVQLIFCFRDLKMENILLDEKHKNLKVLGKFVKRR